MEIFGSLQGGKIFEDVKKQSLIHTRKGRQLMGLGEAILLRKAEKKREKKVYD